MFYVAFSKNLTYETRLPMAPLVLRGNSHGAFLGEVVTHIIALPDNIIRNGQVEGIGKGDIRGQVRFVADLFNVAA